ncbi:MAG: cation-transporting P-type ATPase, partial [Clostridia bacterium]|nr:cation-transporting P-type ATPase [Clostridia bacterium]
MQETRGLTTAEAERSREAHGRNVLPTLKRRSFLSRFLGNLGDPVIRVLLLALGLNIAFLCFGIGKGDVFETVGIAVSVLLATTISTLSEHSSDAAFQRLSNESGESTVRVRRDGTVCALPVSDVVCGDVVLLSAGETVPADGRILSGAVGCDQSALTGESREMRKCPVKDAAKDALSPSDPSSPDALFRGCTILTGECEFLVQRVGQETFLGEISREVQEETRESPLKVRLSRLARQISVFGYVAAFLIAFAYLFVTFVVESGFELDILRLKLLDLSFVIDSLLHALTLGLTVIVVAVPEGLPLMVAVVLSSNMKRMVKDRVLVRKPVGIESAGSMNLLFTDKTGTLTDGRLSVSEILLGDGTEIPSVARLRPHTALYGHYLCSALRNTSSVVGTSGTETETAIGGNGTDRALLLSIPKDDRTKPLPARTAFLPFDSARKYAAATAGGITYVKGAPEKLLPFVSTLLLPDGSTVPFSSYR